MKTFQAPRIQFTEHRLENGLHTVLHRNGRIPLVHVSLHYRVGSSHEVQGRSGLAHLFEHMMFQGSANIGKNEHGRLIDQAGGRWNAATSKDRTNYFETVPSHYLERALWMEADRMNSLQVTEDNFENQRQTVIEEKKQSYDNQPYGLSYLRFDELAYTDWAYAHPIIGSVEDLQAATIDDALSFHQTHYGPGNAVLVLAGDFDQREAIELIESHFGQIPDRTSSQRPELVEPTQQAEKVERMSDPLAVLPAVAIGYHMPELDSPDHYALSVLALVLADGDSSRFYRSFVYDNNWITGLYAGPNQYRGPQIFRIWFQVQRGIAPEAVIDAVDAELDRIRERKVGEEEMEKARNQMMHRFISRMSGVYRLGELLAQAVSLLDDPDQANRQLDRFLDVSAEDIRSAAQRVFSRSNRTLILVEPGNTQ